MSENSETPPTRGAGTFSNRHGTNKSNFLHWIIFTGVFFGYGAVVAILDTVQSPHLAWWLSYTEPVTDFLIPLIPGAASLLEDMGVSGYASRVPLNAHIYAAALVQGAGLGLLWAPYYTGRKASQPNKIGTKHKLFAAIIVFVIGGGFVVTNNVVIGFRPEPTSLRGSAFAGHLNNYALVLEYAVYGVFFLCVVMSAVLFWDALVQALWRKS